MRDRYFLDTNIFVYSFDSSFPDKQEIAIRIIKDGLIADHSSISYQVVQEFINVSTKKFASPLTHEDCLIYCTKVLFPLCAVYSSQQLFTNALDIARRWKFSFYGSLIIASAIGADCTILYSEDFQHNQKIQDLTIINPFIES